MSGFNKILLFFNIFVIVLIVMVAVVYAWTNPSGDPPTGAGALYYSGGYIGIGTASPSAYLHLNGANVSNRGQLTIEATDYPHISFYSGPVTTTNMEANLYYDVANSDLVFSNFNNGAYGDLALNPGGGNVGIGTAAPGNYKLYVSGNEYISGTSTIAGNLSVSGPGSNTCTKVAYNYPATVSCPQYYYVTTIANPTQTGDMICCKINNY